MQQSKLKKDEARPPFQPQSAAYHDEEAPRGRKVDRFWPPPNIGPVRSSLLPRQFLSLVLVCLGLVGLAWLLTPQNAVSPGSATKSASVPHLGVLYISSRIDLNNPSVKAGAQGLVVTEVKPDSPASRAGLQANDLLTHLANRPLLPDDSLLNLMATYQTGDKVSLRVLRESQPLEFILTL